MVGARAVEPVVERRVGGPRVLRPDVVGDLILYHLHAERVGLFDQLAQGRHVAEAVFDGVVIDGVVAVVVGVRAPRVLAAVEAVPVVVPRRRPDGGDAEVFEVGQAVDDAAQVAAVPRARVAAVVGLGRRVRGRVARGVAVAEPVGHDEVDHVVGRDALKIFTGVERRVDAEVDGRGARARAPHRQLVVAGPRGGADAEVGEEVGAARVRRRRGDRERRTLRGGEARAVQALPADEEADGVEGVAGPPRRRLHFIDGGAGLLRAQGVRARR